MNLPKGLKLLAPGYRGRRYYYVRGTIDGRSVEVSTRTDDINRAAEVARQVVAAKSIFYVPLLSRLVLPIEEIRALDQRADCGLYFLFMDGALQYVGQSHRIAARIKRHRELREVAFDEWHVLRCEVIDLDLAEALYVRHYQPPFNRGVNRMRTKNPSPKSHKIREVIPGFSTESI